MLKTYSEALGIAYQLKDDLEDYMQDKVLATHPSAVLALQNEHPTWSGDEVRIELQRLTEHFHQEALDVKV